LPSRLALCRQGRFREAEDSGSRSKIALDLNLGHPLKKLDVARYMYGRMLDLDPGTVYHYSNFGYLLAGPSSST
jgi:hypothetical protein